MCIRDSAWCMHADIPCHWLSCFDLRSVGGLAMVPHRLFVTSPCFWLGWCWTPKYINFQNLWIFNGCLMYDCRFCDGCITFQYCLHGVINCLNVLWVMMMSLEMVPAILEYIKKTIILTVNAAPCRRGQHRQKKAAFFDCRDRPVGGRSAENVMNCHRIDFQVCCHLFVIPMPSCTTHTHIHTNNNDKKKNPNF